MNFKLILWGVIAGVVFFVSMLLLAKIPTEKVEATIQLPIEIPEQNTEATLEEVPIYHLD